MGTIDTATVVPARHTRIVAIPIHSSAPTSVGGIGSPKAAIIAAERAQDANIVPFVENNTFHATLHTDEYMVDTEAVREALRDVYDPEIPVNIVDLGLVYDITEREDAENAVHIEMTLTSMGCPVADSIKRNVSVAAESVEGCESATVELVYEPPWSPAEASDDGKAQLQSLGIRIPDYDDEDEAAANQAPF